MEYGCFPLLLPKQLLASSPLSSFFACIARGGGGVDGMGVFKCLHKDLSIIDLIHHLVFHCRDLNHHRDPCAFL